MPEVVPADGFAQFKAWMRSIEQRLDKLETARRLENASLSGGAFSVLDAVSLAEQVRLGLQDDGTYGLNVVGGRLTVEGATVDAISASVDYNFVVNTSLDTTEASKVTNTLTKPSWATRALLIAIATLQVSNGSGGTQTFYLRVGINGTGQPGAGRALSFPTGYIHSVTDPFAAVVSGGALGSTVTNHATVWMPSGSNNTNIITLTSIALWMRS